jgi:hypothetical protein
VKTTKTTTTLKISSREKFLFSVKHRGSLGGNQLLKHQATPHLKGTSGKSFVLKLVARQTTHRFKFSRWKIDYLGCFFDKQGKFVMIFVAM